MPKLDWIGKEAVVQHHNEVPYRLLHCDKKLSAGNPDSGNLLVQGDNLDALKSLLPYYEGQVNCIYIDPPYNTGNESWVYNDKVNSPQIQRWLNKVVGGEEDDLCRHDKWLCMMYPRLRLLRNFLRDDGVIFVSIDDNEQHRLRMLMDELFGTNNFVNALTWVNKLEGRQTVRSGPATTYETILVYARDVNVMQEWNQIAVSEATRLMPLAYKQQSHEILQDEYGPYVVTHELHNHNRTFNQTTRPNLVFIIHYNPKTKKIKFTDIGEKTTFPNFVKILPHAIAGEEGQFYAWRWSREKILTEPHNLHFEGFGNTYRVWTKSRNFSMTRFKNLITNISGGARSLKSYGISFPNPKPMDLVRLLIQVSAPKDAVIMDSFAGSGTTAHAVLQKNKEDDGNRRFILIEMDESIAETITAKRIQRIVNGYKEGKTRIAPLEGGFRYCTLGKPLFDELGRISSEVKFNDLAAHIFFSETGSPIPKKPQNAFLGMFEGQAIYLLFNGIMDDKNKNGGNILTVDMLHNLPPHTGDKKTTRVIYGEGSILSPSRLKRENIVFRQIPYQIKKN